MLFGDEKRFAKNLVPSSGDSQVLGVSNSATDSNLGPGAYYNNVVDEKRNGWKPRSFSKRSPMTPPPRESLRADSYIGGVLTPYGTIVSPVSPKDRISVGPGHYDSDVMTSFSPRKKSFRQGSDAAPSPRKDSTTPRFAFSQSSVLKDGVIFQSRENDSKPIGPGYYALPLENTLLRPSFNVRASPKRATSPHNTGSLRSSGLPNGSGRPRSASSGPRSPAMRA